MGAYKSAIITTAGQNLIAQALAGSSAVKFTALKTSYYSYPASTNFEALTSLQGVKQSTGITSAIVVNQTTVKISARVSNVGITSAYYINTIGVYAETDGITETLIAVIPASTADLVPVYSTGAPYSFIYDINLTIQNSTSLNVTINDSGVATVADLQHFYEKTYDVYVTDTASGEIASFEDGADKIPMESVNVSMTPRQSFNGYDHPWPAGGGKNLLEVTATTQTINGVTFTVNEDGSIKVNGTASILCTFNVATLDTSISGMILNGCPEGGNYISGYALYIAVDGRTIVRDIGDGATIPSLSGNTVSANIIVRAGVTVSNLVFKPMIRLASETDDTFEPYSNICPISGWNAVNVTRTGKNLLDTTGAVNGGIDANGGISISPTDTRRITRLFPVKANTAYYLWNIVPLTQGRPGFWYDADGNGIGVLVFESSSATSGTVTSPVNAAFCRICYPATNANTCMMSLGNTQPTAYVPYTGNTYTVTFPSDTGTVYGGTVDIANGELTVTDANIVSYNGETLPGEWLSSYDKYAEGATPTTGAQVVYKLATPQTIQLSPTEIDSLYGYNNVWSDVGNVDVKYRADTTLYINKKIAEMQALILENS